MQCVPLSAEKTGAMAGMAGVAGSKPPGFFTLCSASRHDGRSRAGGRIGGQSWGASSGPYSAATERGLLPTLQLNASRWRNRSTPTSTGVNWWRPNSNRFATPCPWPTRRWAEPAERAAAILEFLQGPGGRTGSIPIDELKQLHIDICLERDWEIIGWTAVGRELRELLKADKTYDRGERVYRIPPLAGRSRLRAV